jgi:hypothetical protein
MLLTRFWQRGAETTLSLNYPIPEVIEEEELPRASFNSASFIPAGANQAPAVYDPPAPPADLIPTPEYVEPPLGEVGPVVIDQPPQPRDPPGDLYRAKTPTDPVDL